MRRQKRLRRVSARLTDNVHDALAERAAPGKLSAELSRAIEVYLAVMRVLEGDRR